MAIDFGYTPDIPISGWGNASESKQESKSWGGSSAHSSSASGWNPWQRRLGDPWNSLNQRSIDTVKGAYGYGMPHLRSVVNDVLNWSSQPPSQYTQGWEALYGSWQPTATQEFYERSVRDPALREWQQVALPGLREAYAGNYYHGDRMRREAEMARDLALNLANKRADLEYQSQEAAKQRALQGAPISLQFAEFIPRSQANFLSGYLESSNPLLQALTAYMTTALENTSSSSSHSSRGSHSASHTVSGWRPQDQDSVPVTRSPGVATVNGENFWEGVGNNLPSLTYTGR